jgi:hypothetical protein
MVYCGVLVQLFVGQLRGGVNQLLPCLNNYASFKILTRHSMMITIMQGNKQMAHSTSITYMRNTETDIFRGNPYRVKTSSSLYDKYYLHSLYYHTYEHQLIVRLQPLFCKMQLAESTNSLFSLAPTRRKHQLPGFSSTN